MRKILKSGKTPNREAQEGDMAVNSDEAPGASAPWMPPPHRRKSPRTRGPEPDVTKAVTVRGSLGKGAEKVVVLGPGWLSGTSVTSSALQCPPWGSRCCHPPAGWERRSSETLVSAWGKVTGRWRCVTRILVPSLTVRRPPALEGQSMIFRPPKLEKISNSFILIYNLVFFWFG